MVTNDAGYCLIYTTDRKIADYVNYHSRGAPPTAQLAVGGDAGHPELGVVWRYTRKVSK